MSTETLHPTNASTIPGRGVSDPLTKTIRNAYQAAKRDGRTRYVGNTYLSFFIETDPERTEVRQHGAFKIEADGTVYKINR